VLGYRLDGSWDGDELPKPISAERPRVKRAAVGLTDIRGLRAASSRTHSDDGDDKKATVGPEERTSLTLSK